jgi:hypothetical protein
MCLRFTVRDLLWLAVVVALAVGWWLDRARYANFEIEIRHLQKALQVERFDKEMLSRDYDRLSAKSNAP